MWWTAKETLLSWPAVRWTSCIIGDVDNRHDDIKSVFHTTAKNMFYNVEL